MTEPRGHLEAPNYPWEPDGTFTANLAIANVRDALLRWLTLERGVHTETLMMALGSLAGMAAQEAVWTTHVRPGKHLGESALVAVQIASGETYYFGEAINGYLLPQGDNNFALWNFVAGALVATGVPPAELPDIRPIFEHAAETVGSPEFEVVQVQEEHQPLFCPRKALELFWLPIAAILGGTAGPGPANGNGVANEHWVIVLGIIIHQLIDMSKEVLDPKISAQIVMGAAVIASKFDRKTLKLEVPE